MDQSQAGAQLFEAAASHALARGFRIAANAEAQLRAAADAAAQRLFQYAGGGEPPPGRMDEAILAFRTLVDTMIGFRDEAYSDRPEVLAEAVIGESTLGRALGSLCPGFYPIC